MYNFDQNTTKCASCSTVSMITMKVRNMFVSFIAKMSEVPFIPPRSRPSWRSRASTKLRSVPVHWKPPDGLVLSVQYTVKHCRDRCSRNCAQMSREVGRSLYAILSS